MSSESWESVLNRIEADLAATEEALAHGERWPEPPVGDAPAVSMPPGLMPAALGPRAQALLGRTRSLEARAVEEFEGIRDALRALAGRRTPAPTHTGRIVDVGA